MFFKRTLESEEYRKLIVKMLEVESKLLNLEQIIKVLGKEFEAEIQLLTTNANSLRGLINRKLGTEQKEEQKSADGKVYLGDKR